MKKEKRTNQKGLATVEALPLLVIFVILLSYALGTWGVVHTAILSSIGARAYAFETFRNRTNLIFHRDIDGSPQYYNDPQKWGFRLHRVTQAQTSSTTSFIPKMRRVNFSFSQYVPNIENKDDENFHNKEIYDLGENYRPGMSGIKANPVWIKTGYGICLNSQCGGSTK